MQSAQMEFLAPSVVPCYLRDSEFGASLNYDDDEEFSVPIGVTKPTPEVRSLDDLTHLLATVRFWGLRELPATVLEFAFSNERAAVIPICKQYANELLSLATIVAALRAPEGHQMSIAMKSGYLDLVKYLLGQGHKLDNDSVCLAVKHDRADCLLFALQENRDCVGAACMQAVEYNSLACIRVILEFWSPDVDTALRDAVSNMSLYLSLCNAAACVGNVEYIKLARQHNFNWKGETTLCAASNGQLDCLKYLHESGCPWYYEVVSAAAKRRHFDCVAYALQHGLHYVDTKVVDLIVAGGDLRCLKLLSNSVHQDGRRRVHQPCLLAAQHGHLDCLIFLHEHQYRWDDAVTTAAAVFGNYDCLEYAVQHGCPIDKRLCSVLVKKGGEKLLLRFAHLNVQAHMGKIAVCAAGKGYMKCLQYAVAHGCPAIATVCASAASRGKLECLQYLRAQCFPWDYHITRLAARRARYDCLKYALQQGCAIDVRTVIDLAAKGQMNLQQYGYCGDLRTRTRTGLTHDECIYVTMAAAQHGQLACLQYLHEQLGFPVMYKLVSAAAVRKGQWECVRYLAQQGCDVAKDAVRKRP